jgi:methylglutaconyl-CoA hydratase
LIEPQLLLREDHGPIAVLTLNRPDRRNALSRALIAALSDGLDALAAEPGVRGVVLTGAGPAFCAGMDLAEADASSSDEAQAVRDLEGIAHLLNQVRTHPRPTVAAVAGPALAAGAGLALACDFVVMAADARLGYPEVRRGLVPAVVVHDLVRQAGDRRARALLLSGEPISAATAEAWGLVNRVVPAEACLDEARALARSLLGSAPQAVAAIKRLIDEATARPRDLRGAAAVSAAARCGDEAAEGMRAFLEKRLPRWERIPTSSQLETDQ